MATIEASRAEARERRPLSLSVSASAPFSLLRFFANSTLTDAPRCLRRTTDDRDYYGERWKKKKKQRTIYLFNTRENRFASCYIYKKNSKARGKLAMKHLRWQKVPMIILLLLHRPSTKRYKIRIAPPYSIDTSFSQVFENLALKIFN